MYKFNVVPYKNLNQIKAKTVDDIKEIIILFFITRVVFFMLFLCCTYIVNVQYDFDNVYLMFDGSHYFNIALNGYTEVDQYAFFPLFPLVIRLFSFFNIAIPGTLVTNHLMTLAVAILLYFTGLNVLNRSRDISLMMSKLWIFSPIAVSTCILYSEPLFVLLTLSTYYAFKNKKYLTAGILLGLSVATRSLGSMLYLSILAVMVLELLSIREKNHFKNILLMYIPATIISCLYPMYLFLELGNWRYFLEVQYEYWGRINSNFFVVLFNDIKMISTGSLLVISFAFTYVSFFIIVYVIYHSLKDKKNVELTLYVILSLIAIFSTSREIVSGTGYIPSTSYYRYFYGIISVYLLVNEKMKTNILLIVNMFMSIIAMIVYFMKGFLL